MRKVHHDLYCCFIHIILFDSHAISMGQAGEELSLFLLHIVLKRVGELKITQKYD